MHAGHADVIALQQSLMNTHIGSTGSMTFTNVPPFESDFDRPYILRVVARTADKRRAVIRRVIRIGMLSLQ